ncbi:MAG: TPR Domain containing protein [uncultured bacterium]|nr:MAG: TPR Domain containing protein [uncultured bacterium]HBH17506.1 hypothetical protein [Cyanobacteria bacterium UBA9579]
MKKSVIFLIPMLIIASVAILFHNHVSSYFRQTVAFYYVFKGDQYYQESNYQKAINNYNYALQLYPEHTKAQYNLGNIYTAFEDFYSAVDCYEKALNIKPNYVNARINLGIILSEELHDIDRAINEYINAIDSKPKRIIIPFLFDNSKYLKSSKAIAYYNLGLAYRAKSLLYSYDNLAARTYLISAADSYRKSLKIEPNNYDARYNLALTLHVLGNYSESLQEYCKAIQIEPINYDVHYNLALLLKQMGRYQDALSELEKASLIISVKGDIEQTQYMYQILSDVRLRASVKDTRQNNPVNKKKDKSETGTFEETMQSCDICKN